MSTPAPFRTIGRYELLEVIGRGGAAVVYLAQQRDLRRLVALKELAPVQAADTTFAARFVDESRVAGLLNHPNVVTVHEFFEADGVPFIAMEYLAQGSLRPYVGAVSLAQFAGVLEGVLAGLSHGQSHGIVHRDLKPENLLVTADGRVKIADFGVARALGQAITREVVTVAGTTIGTPAYMAPEQALGEPLTHATDLYSLGVVAYELLAGQLPFTDSETPVAVLYRHVHEPVPPINDVVPDIDSRLAQWLDRMLAKHPGDRFENADGAWEALEDVVLELLGPRWRREARLAVYGRPAAGAAPLTPAAFETGPVADAARPPSEPAPVAPTVDELPAPPPAPSPVDEAPEPAARPAPVPAPRPAATGPLTVAPRRRVPVAVTTIVRLARRHPDEQPLEPRGRERRRRAAGAGLVVLAAAAVAVAVALSAGAGTPKRPRPRATRPTVASARVVDARLLVLLDALGTRRRTLAAPLASPTATAAARDRAATRVAAAYASALGGVAALPADIRASATTASVRSLLSRAEQAYTSLAQTARVDNATAYGKAAAEVTTVERQLSQLTARL